MILHRALTTLPRREPRIMLYPNNQCMFYVHHVSEDLEQELQRQQQQQQQNKTLMTRLDINTLRQADFLHKFISYL